MGWTASTRPPSTRFVTSSPKGLYPEHSQLGSLCFRCDTHLRNIYVAIIFKMRSVLTSARAKEEQEDPNTIPPAESITASVITIRA